MYSTQHGTELQLPLITPHSTLQSDTNEKIQSPQAFEWLNRILLYFPMWTKASLQRHKPRSKCFSFFVVILVLIMNTTHCAVYVTQEFIQYSDDIGTLVAIYVSFLILCTMSRFFSLHYFYAHFDFPWTHDLPVLGPLQRTLIKKYNWFIFISFAIIIATDTSVIAIYILDDYRKYSPMVAAAHISLHVIDRLFIYYPLDATFASAAALFAKYHLLALQCVDAQQADKQRDTNINENVEKMLSEYRRLKKLFDRDYHLSLQRCLLLSLSAIALSLWTESFFAITTHNTLTLVHVILGLSGNVCLLLLYFVPAALMTEAFVKYETLLEHEYGGKKPKEINHGQLVYFLRYMNRHPIAVRVGKTMITKHNAAAIVTVFVMAKFFGYSLHAFGY